MDLINAEMKTNIINYPMAIYTKIYFNFTVFDLL